jgi:hypothetical protein
MQIKSNLSQVIRRALPSFATITEHPELHRHYHQPNPFHRMSTSDSSKIEISTTN